MVKGRRKSAVFPWTKCPVSSMAFFPLPIDHFHSLYLGKRFNSRPQQEGWWVISVMYKTFLFTFLQSMFSFFLSVCRWRVRLVDCLKAFTLGCCDAKQSSLYLNALWRCLFCSDGATAEVSGCNVTCWITALASETMLHRQSFLNWTLGIKSCSNGAGLMLEMRLVQSLPLPAQWENKHPDLVNVLYKLCRSQEQAVKSDH